MSFSFYGSHSIQPAAELSNILLPFALSTPVADSAIYRAS